MVVYKKENTTDKITDVQGLDEPLFLLGSILSILTAQQIHQDIAPFVSVLMLQILGLWSY